MTVDEYLAGFSGKVAERLAQVREVMVAEVGRVLGRPPEERIRYGMPAVMLDDRAAVYFAAWLHHIAIYPVGPLSAALESEVSPLRAAKDTVQLKHARPLPLDLVARITAEVAQRYRD